MDALSRIPLREMPRCRPRQPFGLTLDIKVADRHGRIIETRRIESDIVLRNFMCNLKRFALNVGVTVADLCKDVLNNTTTSWGLTIQYQMLGSGATAPLSSDYRIQSPLYTAPDAGATGTVLPGAGNQVIVAVVAAHTFATATSVSEAGVLTCGGSTVTYLTAQNVQHSRDVFAPVAVPAGGTFTGTYTWTAN